MLLTCLWRQSQYNVFVLSAAKEGKNQALVKAILFCDEYPGPRSEDKFESANQMEFQ